MPPARTSNRTPVLAAAFTIPATYADLLRAVRAELFTGRVKIEYAWLMMLNELKH